MWKHHENPKCFWKIVEESVCDSLFPLTSMQLKEKSGPFLMQKCPSVCLYKQKQNQKPRVNPNCIATEPKHPLPRGGISGLHNQAWGAHFVMLKGPQWCNSRGGGISKHQQWIPFIFPF